MKLLFENWRKYLNEQAEMGDPGNCIPLDEWNPPTGLNIYSHSTGKVAPSNFSSVVEEGFRVATGGRGSLSITFLEERGGDIRESLRERVSGTRYNLGKYVILAGINPELQRDYGVTDNALAAAKGGYVDPMGVTPIKNVRIFEEYPVGHKWQESAWKLPGRFLMAIYDGINDRICLNSSYDGSVGTKYGERMVNNLKEYEKIAGEELKSVPEVQPVIALPTAGTLGAETDEDVF